MYTFAGACVYQSITGSTTVGVDGRVSNLGTLVWFGPLVVGTAVMLFARDRGPFRRLYLPRASVQATVDDLAWSSAMSAGAATWAEIGGVSSVGDGPGRTTTVYGLVGEPLAELRGEFEDVRTRDRRSVTLRILDLRPDRYEPVDPSRPGDGCVWRDAPQRRPAA